MSNIHVIPTAAGTTARVTREEHLRPATSQPSDDPGHPDQDMMHAWSIGVTTAAHEYAEQGEHADSCPPEVYIG